MIKKTVKFLKEDYDRKTFIFTIVSIIINLAFATYNGVIGLLYNSIWHKSIFGYYLLLMGIKLLLVLGEKNTKEKNRMRILYFSFLLLIVISIAMIAPSIFLVQGKKEYDWGLIPAIAMAAYTTYSITMSIINMTKAKASDNVMVKQIRLINMISVLMSLLVLQNTLILANDGYNDDMKVLSICTSIGIIIAIVIMEIYSFVKVIKTRDLKNNYY